MNLLELTIAIPIYVLIILSTLIIVEAHWIWRYFDNLKTYCPEATLFKTARQKGIAIMQKWYMSGFFVFELLEKEKKGDMYTKLPDDSHEGIRFDPRIQSKTNKSYTLYGLEIYQYGSNSPYNLSVLNAVAMDTIINYVNKTRPELNFLSAQIILEYCQKSKNILIQDCLNLVSTYSTTNNFNLSNAQMIEIKDAIRSNIVIMFGAETDATKIEYETEKEYILQLQKIKAEKLAKTFNELQAELIELEIEPQYFSFADAFQNVTSCILATDIQTYKQLIDTLSNLKREKFDMNFLFIVGFAVLLILIGAGLFYMITT